MKLKNTFIFTTIIESHWSENFPQIQHFRCYNVIAISGVVSSLALK